MYFDCVRLAMMMVAAYGARTRTVSAPSETGLTPVITTIQKKTFNDSCKPYETTTPTIPPSNLLLERLSSSLSSRRIIPMQHICSTRKEVAVVRARAWFIVYFYRLR